jgi:hypothetical protein
MTKTWAKCEVLERVTNNLLAIEAFWMYVKSKWLSKTEMWVVSNQNLPYVRQEQMWPLKITMQI